MPELERKVAAPLAPQTLYATEELEPENIDDGKITRQMLQDILDDQNRKNEALVRAVLERGRPLQDDLAAPELEISFDGLPDPSIDPQGYHKEVASRTKVALSKVAESVVKRSTDAVAVAADEQRIRDEAINLIRATAPDLPQDLIDYAALKVANEIKSRGENPMDVLRRDTIGVAQSILDTADATLGLTLDRRSAPTGEVNRTGGMLAPRTRRPAASPKPQEQPGDMVSELKAAQKRFGIY